MKRHLDIHRHDGPRSAADHLEAAFSEINVAANTTASFVICNSGGIGCGAGTGETNFSGVLQVTALSDTAYVTTGPSFNQGIHTLRSRRAGP